MVTVVVGAKGDNISHDYPTNIRMPPAESGLLLETVFLCFQIRSLDPKRFPEKPAGKFSDKLMEKTESTVWCSLGCEILNFNKHKRTLISGNSRLKKANSLP